MSWLYLYFYIKYIKKIFKYIKIIESIKIYYKDIFFNKNSRDRHAKLLSESVTIWGNIY